MSNPTFYLTKQQRNMTKNNSVYSQNRNTENCDPKNEMIVVYGYEFYSL